MGHKPIEELWPEDLPESTSCIFHGSEFLTDTKTGKLFCPICREDGGITIKCRRCPTEFLAKFDKSTPCPKCGKGHIISAGQYK